MALLQLDRVGAALVHFREQLHRLLDRPWWLW
jgi:hypothetical protein